MTRVSYRYMIKTGANIWLSTWCCRTLGRLLLGINYYDGIHFSKQEWHTKWKALNHLEKTSFIRNKIKFHSLRNFFAVVFWIYNCFYNISLTLEPCFELKSMPIVLKLLVQNQFSTKLNAWHFVQQKIFLTLWWNVSWRKKHAEVMQTKRNDDNVRFGAQLVYHSFAEQMFPHISHPLTNYFASFFGTFWAG